MPQPTLLVLAAGIGSRYGGLKQIDPVGPNGEKIIDYTVFDAKRAGFGKVVFVIRRDIEAAFREAIGDRVAAHIDVQYVFQDPTDLPTPFQVPEGRSKPWGTGHAVLAARGVIREPFGVVNADDFYGARGFQLLADALSTPAAADLPEHVLVAYLLRNTLSENGSVARGVCRVSADGWLETVREYLTIEARPHGAFDTGTETAFTGDERVSMNMWGFRPEFFAVLQQGLVSFLETSLTVPKSEYLLPEVVDGQIQAGNARARVLETPDSWIGVTYPEDKPVVKAAIADRIARGEYPATLWEDPA